MDRSDKDRKSSKRSRDDHDSHDHKQHRSKDRDSDNHHHHRHHRSEKDSHRDRDRSHTKAHSRHEDREGSGDRERSSEPLRNSRERPCEDREEGHKKRKEREGEDAARGEYDRADRDRERKRERRRFGDKVKKEEEGGAEDEGLGDVAGPGIEVRVKVKEEDVGDSTLGNGASNRNGATVVSSNPSRDLPNVSLPPGPSPEPSKVSSISNTNGNTGVSVTRSHEVPGNSSTDGISSSAAGKSGSISLDALAKAKKALQMQKELSEKLKRLPQLTKSTSSSRVGSIAQSSTGSAAGAQTTSATVLAAAMPSPSVSSAASSFSAVPGLAGLPNYEAVKRAQELAAKMGFRQDPHFAPLINLFPGQMQPEISVPQKPSKAPVLRVDALGREIDEHGNIVNATKPSNLSTLKVNINKQKKEAFQILKPEIDMDPESNPFFDPRMGVNKTKLLRPKRGSFQFVEEGKWAKEAEIMKIKNKFGDEQAKDMKARQALHAKAKAAPDINPNLIEVSERVITKEKMKDPIPEIEWWDVPLLRSGSYAEIGDYVSEDQLRREKITIYVEHPRPIEPPAEPAPPPPQPLKLTKKEQKKLRTQRRLAREKDRQEMIRQGLIEPPKPKVKMSNLMKVLGSEATQDPTRLEMEIRSAAAEREQAHIDRNVARKLTPAERRQKKERKLFDDPNTLETIVSVYRINKLSDKKTRFKVDVNAHENRLTGCCVISDRATVVVVEGGNKSIKRYDKLMLRRINWAEAMNEEGAENEEAPENKCLLVWQGSVAKACFHKFSFHECMTEAAARKIFADAGVGHYWDLAVNFAEDDM